MTRPSSPETIAVISDGSARDEESALEPALSAHARWLGDAGFETCTAGLASDDLDDALGALHAWCGEVTAYCLVHTRADRAWSIRQTLESAELAVVTDSDLRAVVATAQVLTQLRRTGRATNQSKVVIAGSDELFELGPLLTAVGILDLTFWKQADAPTFPLARIAEDADVVVDLRTGPDQDPRTAGEQGPAVIRLPALADSLAVLPGILTALANTKARRLDVDVLAAVAQLLSTTTDAGAPLTTPNPGLTDNIAWAARQAMSHPRGS
ncbi:hypothetical protein SUDANB9_06215 [Streptomyces sp. enrichment culture]